jgi:hypothetical protein
MLQNRNIVNLELLHIHMSNLFDARTFAPRPATASSRAGAATCTDMPLGFAVIIGPPASLVTLAGPAWESRTTAPQLQSLVAGSIARLIGRRAGIDAAN